MWLTALFTQDLSKITLGLWSWFCLTDFSVRHFSVLFIRINRADDLNPSHKGTSPFSPKFFLMPLLLFLFVQWLSWCSIACRCSSIAPSSSPLEAIFTQPAKPTKCMRKGVLASVFVRSRMSLNTRRVKWGRAACRCQSVWARDHSRAFYGELRRGGSDEEMYGLHSPCALPVVVATAEARKWERE